LKTWENFDYIKQIISLENFNFYELDTDFDYKKQALLFMPNNIWSIKNNMNKVMEFLWDFFHIAKWRTLVLFTAFFMIKECYTRLNFSLKKEKINLFAQSIWWWKYKQINFFKENPQNSILIWTDTFWEWVDISWEDLKYLIIHKIPFMVPSDPIFIARSKLFKDSFKDYSIPKSILKLKQWFWRLIRSKKDTWIVIFLDDRINSTIWWKNFLKAFPSDINIKISSTKKFLQVFHI
jgi:Rad3-related DNA helicase